MKQHSERSAAVAVIIPYFQTKKGVLLSVVQSALAQENVTNDQIIVVDDQSPVPARDELRGLLTEYTGRISIVEQTNSGPGAARNKGLDFVKEGTRYVAFLDSDDHWSENHLCRALFALECGYDFYFSDFFFPSYKTETAFNRAKKIRPAEHKPLDGIDQVYAYQGDLFEQIITGNVIGTPTVVYRYEKFPGLRFREEFFNGQDYLFWLDFARLSDKIVFSSLAECDCGLGVNIYAGAGWATDRSFSRLCNEIKLWRSVASFYPLTYKQKSHNDRRLHSLRKSMVRDILHRLHHGRTLEAMTLFKQIKADPQLLAAFLPTVLEIALSKLRTR